MHIRGSITDQSDVKELLTCIESHLGIGDRRVELEVARTPMGAPKLIWSGLARP